MHRTCKCPQHAPWPLTAAPSTLLLAYIMCQRFTLSTKNLFAHFTNPVPAESKEGACQLCTSLELAIVMRTSLFKPAGKLWGHH